MKAMFQHFIGMPIGGVTYLFVGIVMLCLYPFTKTDREKHVKSMLSMLGCGTLLLLYSAAVWAGLILLVRSLIRWLA